MPTSPSLVGVVYLVCNSSVKLFAIRKHVAAIICQDSELSIRNCISLACLAVPFTHTADAKATSFHAQMHVQCVVCRQECRHDPAADQCRGPGRRYIPTSGADLRHDEEMQPELAQSHCPPSSGPDPIACHSSTSCQVRQQEEEKIFQAPASQQDRTVFCRHGCIVLFF